MLDVASLEKFDFLKNLVLVAGSKGLYRNISNVVILDYEGIEGDFSGFHEGDFVITNLLFAKNDVSKIYPAFEALIEIGVSAFAIKTIFFESLPDDIIALAERSEVPVFLFNDIYIEDVILNITDHLRSSANYNYYEDLIDTFLSDPSHISQRKDLIRSLFPDEETTQNNEMVTALYLLSHNDIDEFSLERNINKLMLSSRHLKTNANLRILKYKKGILLLCFGEEASISGIWNNIMIELNLSSYFAGISDRALPLTDIDIAIERSIHTCHTAAKRNKSTLTYSELGLYHLIFPLYKDRYSRAFLEEKTVALSNQKNDVLKNTMEQLVRHHFDIDVTASALFQHPNTIRYRIGKLKELLDVDYDLEFQILCVLLASEI